MTIETDPTPTQPVLRPPGRLAAFSILGATVMVLGLNWPIMKTGLKSIDPLWFAVLRVTAASAVVFSAAALTKRLRPPPRHDIPVVLSVGGGAVALNLVLVFTALQFVPAGRSSVLVWTAALWTVPIAAIALREHMTPQRWLGLAAGITGIVLVFEPWQFDWSNSEILLGHFLLIGSAVLQASVIVHTRWHRWETSPTEALPWQLLVASVLLLIFAIVREAAPEIDWSLGFVLIVAYQALLATGFAAWGKQVVVLTLQANTVALVLMGIPLVGLVSSLVALGETISVVALLGVIGIGTGVTISILSEQRESAASRRPQPIDESSARAS